MLLAQPRILGKQAHMTTVPSLRFVSTLAFLFTIGQALADTSKANWPNWRGPQYNGSAAAGQTGLPVKFSPTEGVLWAADMAGPAASTPAVWGDHIFVTEAVAAEQKLFAMALDRKTGKVLWRYAVGTGYNLDERSNLASPSPTTDGKHVYFFFGDGELLAYDFAGKLAWQKNLQKEYGTFATQWTYSSSPMLADGRLYIQVLQRDVAFDFQGKSKGRKDGSNDSYVLALDPASGKELWRTVRPSDAKAESLEAFSSPIPYEKQILISGGDCITGHDGATGKELWRWGSWNPTKISHYRTVPSPVAGDGVALACAPKREPIFAVPTAKTGGLNEADILWQSSRENETKDVSSDVSTPAFAQGKFYVVNSDRKKVSCVEPKTGKLLWESAVEPEGLKMEKFESSPTVVDGKIYVIDHLARVAVLSAGDEYKLLAVNAMGDGSDRDVRSCVVAAQGQLFVRTNKKLFCIGK
jgi:outer membrane protein assembly factor BamB